MIVEAALQEDVDVVGLSIMSGAHLPICKKLMALMTREGACKTGWSWWAGSSPSGISRP